MGHTANGGVIYITKIYNKKKKNEYGSCSHLRAVAYNDNLHIHQSIPARRMAWASEQTYVIITATQQKQLEERGPESMKFNAEELEIIIKLEKWINEHLDKNFEIFSSYIRDKRNNNEYETEDNCLSLNTIITLYAEEYYEKNNRAKR